MMNALIADGNQSTIAHAVGGIAPRATSLLMGQILTFIIELHDL